MYFCVWFRHLWIDILWPLQIFVRRLKTTQQQIETTKQQIATNKTPTQSKHQHNKKANSKTHICVSVCVFACLFSCLIVCLPVCLLACVAASADAGCGLSCLGIKVVSDPRPSVNCQSSLPLNPLRCSLSSNPASRSPAISTAPSSRSELRV